MSRRRPTTLLSFAVALAVAAAAGAWLWNDYVAERAMHEEILVARGRAVLVSMTGGLRSHQRLGMWCRRNVEMVLAETARADDSIIGVGIYDKDGRLLAGGGRMPGRIGLTGDPCWLDGGLLVPIAQKAGFCGRGGNFGRWSGTQDAAVDQMLSQPIWVAAFMSPAAYRESLARARNRAMASGTLALAVIVLGLVTVALIQRQGRLGAELALGREREARLEELTRIGAGLAHETKNPLSVIRGLAQAMIGENGAVGERARRIVDESDRMVGHLNAFLQYSRPPAPRLETVELGALVERTAELFVDEARAKGVTLSVDAAEFHARADAGLVRQALVNLLVNTLAACDRGASISIGLARSGAGGTLAVADTGRGISPQDLPFVTQPYFTRSPGGTGLGLAIVNQIAQMHGWRLEIESEPGRGTTVRVEGIEEQSGQKTRAGSAPRPAAAEKEKIEII